MQQLLAPGPSYFFQYLFRNVTFIAPRILNMCKREHISNGKGRLFVTVV